MSSYFAKRFGLNPLLISGVTAFISSIANDTPSGYAPHVRIMMVSNPQPIPNTICPDFDIGDVTISVAINTAPNNKPPLST